MPVQDEAMGNQEGGEGMTATGGGECPKRVGSFGYSTDFLMRKSVRSDIDSIRKL